MPHVRGAAGRRLVGLMSTSALGGSLLLVLGAGPAVADNECGAYAPGAPVICSPDGGPYGRVTYRVPGELDVVLGDGARLEGGLDLSAQGDRIRVTGRDAVLRSDSSTTLHVFNSRDADVRVDVGDVHYTGAAPQEALFIVGTRAADVTVRDLTSTARGARVSANGDAGFSFRDVSVAAEARNDPAVYVASANGRATVRGRSVTAGGHSPAVEVRGVDVEVDLEAVATAGDEAVGVRSRSQGAALIRIGAVSTAGEQSTGLELSGDGNVTLDLGDISTEGAGAIGVATDRLSNFDLINGSIGAVTTTGEEANGLYLYADRIDLAVGSISTTGDHAAGAYVNAYDTLAFDVGSIETSGYGASGFVGWAGDGLTLTAGRIVTTGDAAVGVDVWGDGDLSVDLGEVETRGEYSDAVRLLSQYAGDIHVAADRISTLGDGSAGVRASANGNAVLVEVGEVSTGWSEGADRIGADAHGVEIVDAGEATARVGTVTTRGDHAAGVRVAVLPQGSAEVEVGTLETSGEGAYGVHVQMGEPADAVIRVNQALTRGMLADAVRLENGATTDIELGQVRTEGEQAYGVRAEARDELRLRAGSIVTRGHDSRAIDLSGDARLDLVVTELSTLGDRASALRAEGTAFEGTFGQVATEGYESIGLDVRTTEAIDLQVDRVRTDGGDAHGLALQSRDGDVRLRVGEVETLGGSAHGVAIQAGGDIDAELGRIDVRNAGANGLVASSDGDQTIRVVSGVTAADGVAVQLSGAQVDFSLAEGGVLRGGEAGLRIAASAGSRVSLDGRVSALDGPALDIKGAAGASVDIGAAGRVDGRIDLTSHDDVVNNAGQFTVSGTSDFGTGHDVLNNTGRIALHEANTARTASLAGLERLNNAGVIDLANGVAGDMLNIAGVLNGQTGNSIALDLDLTGATPVADQITAAAFEGLSNVRLSVQGQARLGDSGVVIARSGGAQTGAEIDVAVAEGGFVDFNLVFADGEYRLAGELAQPAFEPTKVASGAQHQWTSGTDVVSARFDQLRAAPRRAAGSTEVWTQAFSGANDIGAQRTFETPGGSLAADLSHEVKSRGLQAGLDRTFARGSGMLTVGLLSSTGRTELRFRNADVTRYEGAGAGVYGHWLAGPFSLGLLAKGDLFKLDYDWAGANLKTRSEGHTVGLRADAAWRIHAGAGWHVEPQASLSWSDTALDRMSARDGAEVAFGDTTSLVGRIGLRVGGEAMPGAGLRLAPFASAHLLKEFEGRNASTLILAGESVAVSDEAPGAWGRVVLGAALSGQRGLGAFIQAERDLGEIDGFTARAGLQLRW